MRGLAILMVVWFHIWQISWLPAPFPWLQFIPETGFVGVAIFFFISGFVISYPFVRARLEGKPGLTWGQFAYRRAMKIVPSYLLSIAIVYVIGYAYMQGGASIPKDLLTHLLFIHNWFFTTYGSINGVLWTLAVEVQFYCLFPLIAFAFLRKPFLTAIVMMLIALAYRIRVDQCCEFYYGQMIEQLPAYLDFFASGMICAWLYVYLRNKPVDTPQFRAISTICAVLGFVLLVVLMQSLFDIRHEPNGFGRWQVYHRTPLALDCALIALGSLFAFRAWKNILGNPVLIFCSVISYNWYIYHQVVARELWWHRLPPWAGGGDLNTSQNDHTWAFWFSIASFIGGLLVAAAVTYLFERPLLRLQRKP